MIKNIEVKTKKIDKIPFEGSWTAGQLLEHVDKAVGADVLYGKTAKTGRVADEKVALIKSIFLNFDTKFKSPEFIEPREITHDKNILLNSLNKKFDQLVIAAETLDDTEECLDFELPGMGKLTRLEWINFQMIHTQRHLHQLKNIIDKL